MAVPWTQIVRWAPQILAVSRELLQRSRREPEPAQPLQPGDDDALGKRVVALEENERRQAELVDRMASQQSELARAVVALHRQVRLLHGLAAVLAVATAAAIYIAVRGT